MKKMTLTLDLEAPAELTPEKLAELGLIMVEAGRDDALATLEHGEGNLDLASHAANLQITHVTVTPMGVGDITRICELVRDLENSASDDGCDSNLTVVGAQELTALSKQINLIRTGVTVATGILGKKSEELEEEYGAEHPSYPQLDWAHDVYNGHTKKGYWEWVAQNVLAA